MFDAHQRQVILDSANYVDRKIERLDKRLEEALALSQVQQSLIEKLERDIERLERGNS